MLLGGANIGGSGGSGTISSGSATQVAYYSAATTLSGAVINIGSPTTANPIVFNETVAANGSISFYGGTSGNGGGLILYGGSHATFPNEATLDVDSLRFIGSSGTSTVTLYRSVDTGVQVFTGGLDLGSGFVRCYGETHATFPGRVEIGSALSAPDVVLTAAQLIATHATATSEFSITRNSATGSIAIYGGSSGSSANLTLYGQTHATLAQRIYFEGTRMHFFHPTASAQFIMMNDSATGELGIYGGSSSAGGTILLYGQSHGSLPAEIHLVNTAGIGLQITNASRVHIGAAGSGQQHRLNIAEDTPGSDTLTLTNGPTGTAGNPAKYIIVTINNNTAYCIPAWAT